MQPTSVRVDELAELISDLSRHMALWRFLVEPDNHKRFDGVFKDHLDFFESTSEAHFKAIVVGTYQLLDRRSDVMSLAVFLDEIRPTHSPLVAEIEGRIGSHQEIFDRLALIRHKVYVHRDARAGPGLVFAAANVSPNAIDACIDVLRDSVSALYNAFLPGETPFECYDEADHRARCACDDLGRILQALSNNSLARTRER